MKIPENEKTVDEAQDARPKKKRPDNVFFGVLTDINSTELVMKAKNGDEASIKLHETVKTICDGVACDREKIKPGQRIRVVTLKTDFTTATRIAALDKNSRFAPAV